MSFGTGSCSQQPSKRKTWKSSLVYNGLEWLNNAGVSVCSNIYGYTSIPYFFGYKTEFFFFQNNLKNLNPSYKMDLDLRNSLGRVKLVS